MSGAKDTLRAIANPFSSKNRDRAKDLINPLRGDFDENFANPVNVLEETATDLGSLFAAPLGEGDAAKDPVPLPVQDDTRRRVAAQRRRAKQSKTGFQSTVLTETLG